MAALRPPVERYVLVTKIDEMVDFPNGQSCKLGVNEYEDGTIDPQGYTFLSKVALEGDIPCFTYALGDMLTLEKRMWMESKCVYCVKKAGFDEEALDTARSPVSRPS